METGIECFVLYSKANGKISKIVAKENLKTPEPKGFKWIKIITCKKVAENPGKYIVTKNGNVELAAIGNLISQ